MRSQCGPRDDPRAVAGRVRAAGSLEQTEAILPLMLGPASGGRRSGRRHEKLARGVACHLPGVRLAAVGRRPASPQRRYGPRHEPFFKGLGRCEERRGHRQSASEGRTYSARLAMMRLLLILSWRRAEPSSKLYRKSWLLNDLIPGFDTEALRVSPSISKGAT